MSGNGWFVEISDGARASLSGVHTKSDWYDALGPWNIEREQLLEAEQALQYGWMAAVCQLPPPLSHLFIGDLRTVADGTGDPSIVFLGAELVKEIAVALQNTNERTIEPLLSNRVAIWLFEPLRVFFCAASARDKAVLVFWGD